MLDFLKGIVDFLTAVGSLIINMVQGLLSIFPLITQSIAFFTYVYAYVPSVLLVFLLAGISICVIFQLIGR